MRHFSSEDVIAERRFHCMASRVCRKAELRQKSRMCFVANAAQLHTLRRLPNFVRNST